MKDLTAEVQGQKEELELADSAKRAIFACLDSLVHKCMNRDMELHNRVSESTKTQMMADLEELRQCAGGVPNQGVVFKPRRKLWARACMIPSPTSAAKSKIPCSKSSRLTKWLEK